MSLLQMDINIQLLGACEDVGNVLISEDLHSIEFVLHNSKNSMMWPQPAAVPCVAETENNNNNNNNNNNSDSDVVFGEPPTLVERAIGPSLFFYAPLGGRISKECRTLLRRGLIRLFTHQLLLLLSHSKVNASTETQSRDPTKDNNSSSSSISMSDSFVFLERSSNSGKAEIANVHWTPQMLKFLLHCMSPDILQFTARLPQSMTLIPFVKDMKSLFKSEKVLDTLKGIHTEKTYQLLFTFKRMEIVRQSLHDEHTADRLASILFNSYLKPAEAMRDAGGESLQPPLSQLCDAVDCYQRALLLAQRGLLYPYNHALRPPPSLEDRITSDLANHNSSNNNDNDNDDIDDEYMPLSEEGGVDTIHDITPGNRHLNVLLRLQNSRVSRNSSTTSSSINNNNNTNNNNSTNSSTNNNSIDGMEEINALYEDPLLASGRVVFPYAHVLMHVWYSLHRQLIIAAANAAQTLLMMISTTKPTVHNNNESRQKVFMGKELQQRQLRAARWCGRVLPLLQRLRKWWNDSHEDSDAHRREWLWLQSMQFKVLLRRAKLLRLAGSLEESQRSLEEAEQQFHTQSSPMHVPLCFHGCDEMREALLRDVKTQLTLEKTALRDEWKQGGGLVLRL